MKKLLGYIRNKWRQYFNRIFYSDTNNNSFWYRSYVSYLLTLNAILEKKLRFEDPVIIVISNNLQIKIITFIYSFITNSDIVYISPKFDIAQINSAILSRKNVNTLIIDQDIISKINTVEKEEHITILQYFTFVIGTLSLLEILTDTNIEEEKLNLLYKKGLFKIEHGNRPIVGFLSPGTTTYSHFVNVPFEVLGKSISSLSYFLGLKAGDKVSVIANFDFFPSIFTLLGFMNGVHFIQPVEEIQSAEDYIDQFKSSIFKPELVIISSDNFRLIWNSILIKVYGNKFMFKLSKLGWITSWIINYCVNRELHKTFGKSVKKLHILNEELGFYCLDILRKSKLQITSSYGYLEQGNFLAFKDPTLFKDKNFIYKPGGTILKESEETFENIFFDSINEINMGEITVSTMINDTLRIMESGDLGTFINNAKHQGSRKYLYVFGRVSRYDVFKGQSLDLIERSIKDCVLIKDCFLRQSDTGYTLYIEPREELLGLQFIGYYELEKLMLNLVSEFKYATNCKITDHVEINFYGMRNVAGKLQYFLLE